MFTQLVMLSTVILLVLAGEKFLQRSKEISYYPGRILAFGLFLAAIGILGYAIRDIFVPPVKNHDYFSLRSRYL